MDSYSYLKALRHPDVLEGIRTGQPTRLPHVELILADLCQQSCKFCSYRLDGYTSNQLFDDRNIMPTAKALEILDDCKEIGVEAIQFTGGGEPTIHKDFALIANRVLELGMKFSLVSNGVRIDETIAETVRKASWVRISLDAATEETYYSIRRCHPSHWQRAQNAIRLLSSMEGVLGVGFVVTPDNWNEITRATCLAKELGAHNIRISAQFSQQDEKLFEGFHAEAAESAKTAERIYSDSRFTVYNRFGERLEDLTLKHPEDQLCGYQFFTTYIGADLNVYRCCGYAYNERGLMGSLKNQRFKDFWMNQARFDEQKAFDARGCERCQFRTINKTLAYVLDEKPRLHEEFV